MSEPKTLWSPARRVRDHHRAGSKAPEPRLFDRVRRNCKRPPGKEADNNPAGGDGCNFTPIHCVAPSAIDRNRVKGSNDHQKITR